MRSTECPSSYEVAVIKLTRNLAPMLSLELISCTEDINLIFRWHGFYDHSLSDNTSIC